MATKKKKKKAEDRAPQGIYETGEKSFILPKREVRALAGKTEYNPEQLQLNQIAENEKFRIAKQKKQLEDLQGKQAGELKDLSKQREGNDFQQQQAVMEENKKRGKLDIVKDLAFGNILEKDPITGEARLDPTTGQPIEVQAGTIPITGAGAVAPFGAKAFDTVRKVEVAGKLKNLSGWSKRILASVGIGGPAIVFNLFTEGKIKELESDITDLRTSSRDIVTDVTQGADPIEAIIILEELEEEINLLSSNLKLANRRSWKTKFTGKTVEPMIFRNINAVVRRRQALERFTITGDRSELMTLSQQVLID